MGSHKTVAFKRLSELERKVNKGKKAVKTTEKK